MRNPKPIQRYTAIFQNPSYIKNCYIIKKQCASRNRSRGTQRCWDSRSQILYILPLLKLYRRIAQFGGLHPYYRGIWPPNPFWEASGGLQDCPQYYKYARKIQAMCLPELTVINTIVIFVRAPSKSSICLQGQLSNNTYLCQGEFQIICMFVKVGLNPILLMQCQGLNKLYACNVDFQIN